MPLVGDNNFYRSDFTQESLYKMQSDAIRKAATENSCVFVGRTADYILRDFDNVVNIFISANMEERVERVSRRLKISSKDAQKYIFRNEEERASYYNYYTGKKWGHGESYDLCINSSLLGIDNTSTYIADFIRKYFKL